MDAARRGLEPVTGARSSLGRGIGLGTHHLPQNQGNRVTYAAAVVDIEVNKDNGVVVAKHVYGAMDCGLAINPGIVESQIVGMSVHGASLALREEVQFNQTNVTSLDWNTYQTLRFGEHPAVTPIVVQQLHERVDGRGRGSAAGGRCRDRQCVLRRDRRETPPIPVDPAACAGGAQVRDACGLGLGRVYTPAHRLRQQR